MERVKIIKHKNKLITYVQYGGLASDKEAEFMQEIEKVTQFVLKHGANQLLLVNVENAYGSSAVVKKMKVDSSKTKHLIKKNAVVGITGVKAIFLKAINLFAKTSIVPFDSDEKAKDWLVKE